MKAALFGAASLDRKSGYARPKTLGIQWGVQCGELPIGAIVAGAVLVRVSARGMI
jgi:hypothetical protein